jgi:hypothetical protein
MSSLRDLIDAARITAPGLADLMSRHLPGLKLGGAAAVPVPVAAPTRDTTTVATAASRYVAAVWGQDFLFTVASDRPAVVSIDRQPPVPITRVSGTSYWFRLETLRLGTTHTFTLLVDGREVGTNTVAGYNPDSYPIAEAARGTLSEMRSITSRIYGGAKGNYWIYANAGIDTVRGAPLMVWQDGAGYVGARDLINYRLQTVTDNLVHRKLIPPMVHLLLAPGTGGETRAFRFPGETQDNVVRSLQYDSFPTATAAICARRCCPKSRKPSNCGRTHIPAAPLVRPPAPSVLSTSPGFSPTNSAACIPILAASLGCTGIRNSISMAATSSPTM